MYFAELFLRRPEKLGCNIGESVYYTFITRVFLCSSLSDFN
jgi:hypothetical protein